MSDIISEFNGKYSTAGFYTLKNSGRKVYNFNPGWRFLKKDAPGAWKIDFDDSEWENISVPHSPELLPENATSSFWYRGPVWYRKHFKLPAAMKGRKIFLYFEGVMQKCSVWINGKECARHEGGYLPFVIDLSADAFFKGANVMAVRSDNSDDVTFPPGRPERKMDYCYFSSIYRDVWMIATDSLHVSDPIMLNRPADGGVFVHSENVSKESADFIVRTNIINESKIMRSFRLETVLKGPAGKRIAALTLDAELEAGKDETFEQKFRVEKPELWHPDHPSQYSIETLILGDGKASDGLVTRAGIRKIEMRGGKFFLNDQETFLFGANRHQDHAYVGCALPNSEHYRDASRMREASFVCFRSHYPQDPSFMDACDELGIFAVTSVPGWWFYTPDYGFPEKAVQMVREMIRINRNRPSCFLWEIGINETFYTADYITAAHKAAHEEYPYPGCFTSEDQPVTFHGGYYKNGAFVPMSKYPREKAGVFPTDVVYRRLKETAGKPIFERESGEHVDNFTGENARGRISRADGEIPMLIQAQWYSDWMNGIYSSSKDTGICLWLAFDHYRGCSNETARQGIMDPYRLPKTSFYLFKSQNDPHLKIPGVKAGPMVHIANYLTPFSPEDITVYSNCEKVRLTLPGGEVLERIPEGAMKHPPVVFKGVFNWVKDTKQWASPSEKLPDDGKVMAEGIIGGKVVARHVIQPATRVGGIELETDYSGARLTADGGDFIIVRAYFIDVYGNRRVMAKNQVYFHVEGEGELISDDKILSNPFQAQFGAAAAFVKASVKAGRIKVTASTTNMGTQSMTIESAAPDIPLLNGIPSTCASKKHSKRFQPGQTDAKSGMSDSELDTQWSVTPLTCPAN